MSLGALEGFVVGLTADRRWTEQAELLQRRGASILHGPAIRTEYLASDHALRAATEAVIAKRPDYLVATTGIGVRAWFEAAQAWGLAEDLVDALTDAQVAARGPKAAAAAQSAALTVWDSPPSERLDEVIDRLCAEPLAGTVVAFQQYGKRNDDAVARLAAHGADVIEVPVYRWSRPVDDDAARRLIDALCEGRVDAVTFTSAPAVQNFLAIARDHGRHAEVLDAFNGQILNQAGVVAACMGPVCAEGARAAGIDAPVAPSHGRLGLLVRVLTEALAARRQTVLLAGRPVVVQGRAVAVDGQVVDLSERERAVLDALLRRRGTVVSKTAMLKEAGAEAAGAHAMEAAVARLRKRLGPASAAIRCVRGRGYILDAADS